MPESWSRCTSSSPSLEFVRTRWTADCMLFPPGLHTSYASGYVMYRRGITFSYMCTCSVTIEIKSDQRLHVTHAAFFHQRFPFRHLLLSKLFSLFDTNSSNSNTRIWDRMAVELSSSIPIYSRFWRNACFECWDCSEDLNPRNFLQTILIPER